MTTPTKEQRDELRKAAEGALGINTIFESAKWAAFHEFERLANPQTILALLDQINTHEHEKELRVMTHKTLCTSDSCTLDGGPEHLLAFPDRLDSQQPASVDASVPVAWRYRLKGASDSSWYYTAWADFAASPAGEKYEFQPVYVHPPAAEKGQAEELPDSIKNDKPSDPLHTRVKAIADWLIVLAPKNHLQARAVLLDAASVLQQPILQEQKSQSTPSDRGVLEAIDVNTCADTYYGEFSNLRPSLKKKLSIDELRHMFEVMVKPTLRKLAGKGDSHE